MLGTIDLHDGGNIARGHSNCCLCFVIMVVTKALISVFIYYTLLGFVSNINHFITFQHLTHRWKKKLLLVKTFVKEQKSKLSHLTLKKGLIEGERSGGMITMSIITQRADQTNNT